MGTPGVSSMQIQNQFSQLLGPPSTCPPLSSVLRGRRCKDLNPPSSSGSSRASRTDIEDCRTRESVTTVIAERFQ